MSVLIKGMEMPKSCSDCKAFVCYRQYAGDSGDCFCGITKNDAKAKEKNADCPLIPAPPHGRLIDADALRQAMYHEAFETDSPMQKWDSGCWIRYKMFERMEEVAPTIIPASEEDAKAEEDTEPWLCLSCRHYPPSSTDGKPCTQCNPSEVWHNCYDPAEEGE